MSAGKYNISIEQGASFSRAITVQDSNNVAINLTGATVRSKARVDYDDQDPVVTFTCIVTEPLNGKFTMTLTDEVTTALDFDKAFYDVEIEYPGGNVDRLLQGNVVLVKEATK